MIDLTERAKPMLIPEEYEVKHFYEPFIPKFSIKTLALKEIIAEKIRAAITRNKPRDHFDIYKIIKSGLPIDMELTKIKCRQTGCEFSIIKMFNKANKLKSRWDKDMISLIAEPITFQEVIKFLADYFKLKEEKEKLKNQK